jgi:hypothetical protein
LSRCSPAAFRPSNSWRPEICAAPRFFWLFRPTALSIFAVFYSISCRLCVLPAPARHLGLRFCLSFLCPFCPPLRRFCSTSRCAVPSSVSGLSCPCPSPLSPRAAARRFFLSARRFRSGRIPSLPHANALALPLAISALRGPPTSPSFCFLLRAPPFRPCVRVGAVLASFRASVTTFPFSCPSFASFPSLAPSSSFLASVVR